MPLGFGKHAIRNIVRPLSVMVHLKKSIIEVKAEDNCSSHAMIIAKGKVDNDSNYVSYRKGRYIRPVVQYVLESIGIDLCDGVGIPELVKFQKLFLGYKIIVYQGLACEDIMFEGQVDSPKRINLLYDNVERQYHVITNITGAMEKTYVFKACNKASASDVTHICDRTCSDCMARPPCAFYAFRVPCTECNRHCRSRAFFDNH
jgi:hypothetical protein